MNNHKHTWDKWEKRNSHQGTRRYKKSHRNFGTEIYDHWDERISGGLNIRMERTEKEPVNLKVGQQTLLLLSSREKADWKEEPDQDFRDLGPEQRHHSPVIRVPEGEGKGGWRSIQRNMDEKFPNSAKDINLQPQEAEWTPNSGCAEHKPRCIIISPTPLPPVRGFVLLTGDNFSLYQRVKSWYKYFPFKIEWFSMTSEHILIKRDT